MYRVKEENHRIDSITKNGKKFFYVLHVLTTGQIGPNTDNVIACKRNFSWSVLLLGINQFKSQNNS